MATAPASFQALCDGLCGLLGLPAPVLAPDALGVTGFTLRMQDVDVSVVLAGEAGGPPIAGLLVEFGPPPPARELAAWQALLDANFLMLGPDAPCFSRNPATGEVVLQQACPLHATTPQVLQARIERMTQVARRWREDGFLGPDPPPRPADPAGLA